MFIGKLIANGFLREEAGDGGANGGGPVSLMAGAGNNAGGDGAGNGDGDGGEGDGLFPCPPVSMSQSAPVSSYLAILAADFCW